VCVCVCARARARAKSFHEIDMPEVQHIGCCVVIYIADALGSNRILRKVVSYIRSIVTIK